MDQNAAILRARLQRKIDLMAKHFLLSYLHQKFRVSVTVHLSNERRGWGLNPWSSVYETDALPLGHHAMTRYVFYGPTAHHLKSPVQRTSFLNKTYFTSFKAWMGLEPMIFGLQDQRLATWPPRHWLLSWWSFSVLYFNNVKREKGGSMPQCCPSFAPI